MRSRRGIVAITLISLIAAGAFTVTGFYFASQSGAFFASQSIPTLLFGKDIEAIVSTSYAVPEDLYVTYRGPRKCSYDPNTRNYECPRDITVTDIRLETGYTKDAATVGFPWVNCLFIQFALVEAIGGFIGSKIDDFITKSAKEAATEGAETFSQKVAKKLDWIRGKIPGKSAKWDDIVKKGEKTDTEELVKEIKKGEKMRKAFSNRKAKRELDESFDEIGEHMLDRGISQKRVDAFLEAARQNPDEVIDELKNGADELVGTYRQSNVFMEQTIGRLQRGAWDELSKATWGDLMKKMSKARIETAKKVLKETDEDIVKRVKKLGKKGEEVSSETVEKGIRTAKMKKDIFTREKLNYFMMEFLRLANCKEANCILPKDVSKALGSRAGSFAAFVLGGPGVLIRNEIGFVQTFYDQFIGEYGYVSLDYKVGDEERDLMNFMFIPNGDDMAFIANTITSKKNTSHYRVRADPLDTTGGSILFEKHKALFDTLTSEENKYYSNGLMEILEGIGKVQKTGKQESFYLYVNPARLIYKNGEMLCERRVARNRFGGRKEEGKREFDIFCYNLSRLPFEVNTSGLQKRLQIDYSNCKKDKNLGLLGGGFRDAEVRANNYIFAHKADIHAPAPSFQIWALEWIPGIKNANKWIKKHTKGFRETIGSINNVIFHFLQMERGRKYAFPQSRYDEYEITISKEGGEIKLSSSYKGPVLMMNHKHVYTEETGFPSYKSKAFSCKDCETWDDMYDTLKMDTKYPYVPRCS